MKTYTQILIIFTLLSLSCKNNNNSTEEMLDQNFEIVKISSFEELKKKDENPLRKSSIIDSSFNVRLETNRDSFIGNVSKVIIYENRIYILDVRSSKGVFEFAMDGKFIRKYGKQGKGPEEYVNINSFVINRKEKHLVISDWGSKRLLTFDLNGRFLKDTKIGFKFNDFVFQNGKYIMDIHNIHYQPGKEEERFSIALATLDGKVTKILPERNKIGHLLASNNLGGMQNGVLFAEPYSNRIYAIKDDRAEPFVEIDFTDKKKIPNSLFKKFNNFGDWINELQTENYCYVNNLSGYSLIDNDILSFNVNKGKNPIRCLYSFKTKKIYPINFLLNETGDITIHGMNLGTTYKRYLISFAQPDWIIAMDNHTKNEKAKKFIRETNINDNPVLIFNRLRDGL